MAALCPKHEHKCMVVDVSDGPCYDCDMASACDACDRLRKKDKKDDYNQEFIGWPANEL